jgi:molecular chaperone DnaK (HSP70)
MTHQIAIDFGTSNTVVAAWNEATRQTETLRLPPFSGAPTEGAPSTIPTLLYVEDAAAPRVRVGAEVRDRGEDVPGDQRFFQGFKRAIAADVPGFSPTLDGVEVTSRLAGELFLRQVLGQLPKAGHPLDEVVFTVPVQAFERYLDWLQTLARGLDVGRIRLLDESTAAALGYDALVPGVPVLVVDFGGGTLDVSLVRTPAARQAGVTLTPGGGGAFERDRVAQVVAKAGQVIGGEDVDHWLLDDFLTRHGRTRGEVADDLHQLKALAERVKVRLSTQPTAELAWFDPGAAKTLKTTYARTDLEDLLEANDFFVRIQSTLDQVLRQAEGKGIGRQDVAQVLLVGGTSLIPAVQRAVRQNFPREKVKSHLPFEAVAHGALQLARGVDVADFLYHGYGIRYWDVRAQRHQYEPIFAPGQPYPTPEPIEIVLRASRPAQPAIELVIGEMEPVAAGASEVVFDGARLVTTAVGASGMRVVPLNDAEEAKTIARLEPPGYPGVDRIRVAFRVDGDRRLRLTVVDLQTDARLLDDQPVVELR